MGNETIKIGVVVDDGGTTKKVTDGNVLLVKTLDNVTTSANKASNALKAAKDPGSGGSKTVAAATKASTSTSELAEYGQARAAGGTGAAGRDFAKQAQGLGGLVHVYATFAANLFAVSAAFTALREAANTEIMVKGLDQLGAASGRSLGSLSKQLVETTGGAISLRDAMGAVAQASSAGLGNKQINDIAVVATKASNALGISMTDAISRLSRGISKIEPELLDELGIFVKVDEATNKYALSVGKTVGSLSDFEKRQAFANAVLEQGKQKFAAIEAAPNPYDKLLASISNLGTAGLELINKVLGPISNLLASSPVALGTVLASIVTVLLKQAIPAIGQFREGLRKSADDALKVAERFKSGFGDEFQTKLEKVFKIPNIQADLKKLEDGLKNVKIPDKLAKGSVGALLSANEEDTKALANANKALDLRNKLIDTGKKGSKDATEAQIAAAKEERDAIQKSIALYQKRLELTSAFDKALGVANQKQGMTDPETIALKRYQDMRKKADQYEAVANASSNAQILGIRKSWALLNQEIEEKGITGIAKYTTLAKGGLTAIGSRVMGLATAFSEVFQLIGVVLAIYSVWDSYASKATKEQEDFNTKVDATNSAVKTVSDSFDLYTKKSSNAFSIEAIGAYTTALAGVSDSLDSQILSFNKFKEVAGAWDKFKDSIGKSNLDKLQTGTIESIKGVVKSLELSGNSNNAKGILAKALFGPDADAAAILGDTKALNKAFDGLTESAREEKINKIAEAISKVREQEEYSTNAAKAFVESLTAIDKLVDQMIQANAFTDLQGKLGVELVQASDKLAQALMDPLKALEDIAKLGKDPKALAVLDSVDIEGLKKAAEYTRRLSDAEKDLGKTASELEKAKSGGGKLATDERQKASSFRFDRSVTTWETRAAAQKADIDNAQKAAEKARNDLESLKKEGASFALSQTKLITEIADAGFAKIEIGLKRAKELADISVSRTALGVASSLGADTSGQEYKLKIQEIDIQKSLIEASYNAQIATNRNTEEITKNTATQQLLASKALKEKSDATAEEKALADIMAKGATRILGGIEAKRALKDGNTSETEVTRLYGKEAVLSAKSSIKTDQIPGMQKEAATAMANANAASALIEKQSKELEFQSRKIADKNTVEKEGLTIQQDALTLAAQLNSYSSASLIDTKYAIQQKSLELDVETKIAKIKSDQARLDLDKVRTSITKDEYDRLTDLNTARLKNIDADKQAKTLANDINSIRDKGTAKQTEISTQQSIQSEKLKISTSLEEAKIASIQKQLDIKLQLNLIDEQTANREKGRLELNSQALKNTQEEFRLKGDILAKQSALDTAKALVTKLGSTEAQTPEQAQALTQSMTAQVNAQAQLDNAKAQLDNAKKVNDVTTKSIADNTSLNQKLIEQKDHLASIASVTENLSAVFGDLGKSLGGVLTALDNMADNQKKRISQLGLLTEGTVEYTALQKKNTIGEINDQAKVAGSVKSLFKEKTFAYKAFHAVETGLRMASLAMELKTSIAKISTWWAEVSTKAVTETALTGETIAGAAARAPITYGEIIGNFTKSIPPPWGIVAGVAAGAYFLSLLGLGGGGGAPPAGFSAEEQQKVNGTGQAYAADGSIVTRAGGVLGDPTALAKSITTALDTLSTEYFGGMGAGSSKIVAALQDIKENTGQTVKALLGKITGFGGSASAFGTTEGSSKVLGGLLGSSSSTIVDAGITIKGVIGDLKNGLGDLQQYENILNKSSGFLGFGGGSSIQVKVRDLAEDNAAGVKAISNVFASVSTVLVESAIALEGSGDRVTTMLASLPVDIKLSTKGLTGQAAADALMAQISVALNDAAEKTFPYVAQYQKIGEEMYDTVARIVKESETLNTGLAMIGKTLVGANAEITTEMQQDLVKKAGGIEKLAAGLQSYYDNFLTAADRFNVSFGGLNKKFTEANMILPRSRAAYKEMVDGLKDLTDPKSRETLAFLLTNAEAYNTLLTDQNSALADTVSNLESSITKFRDFSKSMKDFRDSLMLSASSTATPMEKYVEAKSQFESTYALALSGDSDAMGKLTGISQTFLDLSKTMFASSDKYTQDFNSVLEKIDAASMSATASADVEQLKLDYAKNTVDLLSTINANIAAMAGVQGYASGGRASGWAMVGEQGPEMVNFSNPGQVYTASQTAGMFSPGTGMSGAVGAMIAEIQSLREEVCLLRKDQQKQTGDIIVSNYDANQKASEDVATAVVSASQDVAWTNRSKSEIK